MTAGPTLSSDLFDPDVWADMIQADFKGKARVVGWAQSDNTLVGKPGSTIHFPKWNTLGEFEDLTENVDIVPEKLTQSDGTATIKEVGKGFSFTDTADLVGLGDIDSEGTRQMGTLAARKIDADLIVESAAETEASGTTREQKPYKLDVSGTTSALSWSVIVDAIAMFGDEWEADTNTGLFIRSEQMAQVMKDDEFIKADKAGSTVVKTGEIGMIGGMPVVVTNRLPKNEFRIIQRGALGVLFKRRPIIERDRDILGRKWVVTANVHYAVKRLNDKGIVVGKLQA